MYMYSSHLNVLICGLVIDYVPCVIGLAEYPQNQLSGACQKTITAVFKKCSKQSLEHLFYHCVQSMISESSRGECASKWSVSVDHQLGLCVQSVISQCTKAETWVNYLSSVGHPFYHCVQSRISKSSYGERMSELFFKCGSPVQRLHSPWSARSIKVRKQSYYL